MGAANRSYKHIRTAIAALPDRGVSESFLILEDKQRRSYLKHLQSDSFPKPGRWWKGQALSDRGTFNIATCDSALNLVRALIGPNILLWGAQVVCRGVGEQHLWHSDIETMADPEQHVSIWIGLENTSIHSGLTFVAGSHRIGASIQQVAAEHSLDRAQISDQEILELARSYEPSAEIAKPDVQDGFAIAFTGAIWHASHNTTTCPRTALLLQYMSPDITVQVPNWKKLGWPYEFSDERAPTIAVAGDCSSTRNLVTEPPSR